jgi:hypothetical protein
MAHHSSESSEELSRLFRDLKPGATGRFPLGKLVAEDEGEIRMAIGPQGDKVVIDFGKPTAWVGMTGSEAVALGELLIKHGLALGG